MTETIATPDNVEGGEEEAEECPDFMEDGFLDNLAVVDSCYSDGDENANDIPTSENSIPGVRDGDVGGEPEPPGATQEAITPAVESSPVAVSAVPRSGMPTAIKHDFIPRPVRAKITIKPKPTPIVIEEEGDRGEKADAQTKGRGNNEKIAAAKKAAIGINGDHTSRERPLPTHSDSSIKLDAHKEPVRRERDLRERLRSKEHDGGHGVRERAMRRSSRERIESYHKPRSQERDYRPRSRERDRELPGRHVPREHKPLSRERLPRSRERERLPRSREEDHLESRRPRVTDHEHPNRKWVAEHIKEVRKDVPITKKADKQVERIREKTKETESEDNLLPPGTEDVMLPDAAALLAKKKESADKAKKAEKASKTEKRRRTSGANSSESRKKSRVTHEETYEEKIERDLDRMSRELSLERLKELDRDLRREKMRTSDRELERQRLVNEKLNEEIRQMRELRERRRHQRSMSRGRSVERERRRMEESRRRLRTRRYGDLSPVSAGRNSEFSFEMSPGPSRYEHSRYEHSRRSDRSYSPISSGGDSAGIGSSERSRRRKRSPFWLEMERKLGISVMGGASYEYATAKEPPSHYQSPVPVAVPVMAPLPHPQPAYYAPMPAMYTIPPPTPLPITPPVVAPAPVALPSPVAAPSQLAVPDLSPTSEPGTEPPEDKDESQLDDEEAQENIKKLAPVAFVFCVPPQTSVPEAPPPPQISGENMSLTSFLEATVKAMPAQLTGRAARCQKALEELRDDDEMNSITTGRFVVVTKDDADLQRYTCKTHFDHPAQETLMKLKSPLLRISDVQLKSTGPPEPVPSGPELEDVDSEDDSDSEEDSDSGDEIDSSDDLGSEDDIAIIAEVPGKKVIDSLDLDPIGDSSDGDVPCSECARRSRVRHRSVGVNTATAARTRDVGTQSTWSDDDDMGLDDVSDESDGTSERTRVMRTQYEEFRQSIEDTGQKQPDTESSDQLKSGGRGQTSNEKTRGSTANQKDGSPQPNSNQQKSGGPPSSSSQQGNGGPSQTSSQQKSGGPTLMQPVGDVDWRHPDHAQLKMDQPMFSRRETIDKPFPSQSSFLERPGTLGAGQMGIMGDSHAPEASGGKFRRDSGSSAGLQPLGGNTSFPRGLADSSFGQGGQFQNSPWLQHGHGNQQFQNQSFPGSQHFQGGQPFQGQPFHGSQQFHGSQEFQGQQFPGIPPLLGDSGNSSMGPGSGGFRGGGLLGMAPPGMLNQLGNSGSMGNVWDKSGNQFGSSNLLFAGKATPFLQGGSFVAQTEQFGQQPNPGYHSGGGGRYN